MCQRFMIWSMLIAVTGCTPPSEPPPSGDAAGDPNGGDSAPTCPISLPSCVPIAPEPPRSAACPPDRWIGVRPAAATTCPAVNGATGGTWAVSLLFDPNDATTSGSALPPGLKPYCLYQWRPSTPGAAPDVTKFPSTLAGLEEDCWVVASHATRATLVTWKTLRQAWLQQVGALNKLPPGLSAVSPIRVAVVDTSPDGYEGGRPLAGYSGHGMTVASLVREIGCPDPGQAVPTPPPEESCVGHCGGTASGGRCFCDGSCLWNNDCCADFDAACVGPSGACIAQASMHLALSRLSTTTTDVVHGGTFGTRSELAAAIKRAIDDWQAAKSAQPHLVINLSVGWEPRYDPDALTPNLVKAPARSVFAALTHAACLDAIVVAAAGNRPGGQGQGQDSGPVLPARWETQPAPGVTACIDMEGQAAVNPNARQFTLSPSIVQPLLHSVGGVTGNDEPIVISRLAGRSRLAAPAAHGVSARYDLSAQPAPTDVLSGTSVAAAAVSGIAASVWGYRPSLAAAEVMDMVHSSGVDLFRAADFCLGGLTCPWEAGDVRRTVRRVSLCEAIHKACGAALDACPDPATLPICNTRIAYSDARPRFTAGDYATLAATPAITVDASVVRYSLPPIAACSAPILYNDAWAYPENPCPEDQYYSALVEPWTLSQPGTYPCPSCSVTAKSLLFLMGADEVGPISLTLFLDIDPAYAAKLYGATLRLPGIGNFALPVDRLGPGSVVVVENVASPETPVLGAGLSFALKDDAGNPIGSVDGVLLEQY